MQHRIALAFAVIYVLAPGCSPYSHASPTAPVGEAALGGLLLAQISLEIFDAPQPGGGSTGQRVLTVRNNVVIDVVIDVFTDGPAGNDPAAGNVAQRIAAKVPS